MSTIGTLNDESSTLSTILSISSISPNEQRGYDYELLGGVDSKYECIICLLYMRDPVQTKCGHRFCRACISGWFSKQTSDSFLCPLCNLPISEENTFPDTSARREILACVAKCPYWTSGCKVTLAISDMEKHVENAHPNPFPTLQGLIANGVSTERVNEGIVTRKDAAGLLPEHLRKQLDQHQDAHFHLQFCTCLPGPSSGRPLLKTPVSLYSRQSSQDSEAWLLADDFDERSMGNFRRQRTWDSERGARRKYNTQDCMVPHVPHAYWTPTKSGGPTRHSSGGKESSQSELSLAEICSTSSISTTENDLHLKELMERLVKLEQLNHEKDIKMDKIQKQLSAAVGYCAQVSQAMKDIHSRYSNGVYVWKLSDIQGRCLDLRRNPTKIINSSDFYTHQFGYKMCLRFNLMPPPGSHVPSEVPLKSDESTNVSLYIHFMQGDYDFANEWPFNGEITLIIVHPDDREKSIVEHMRSKPEGAAFARPKLPRNPKGIGYPDMCTLKTLFSDGFAKNDTLIIQVLAKSIPTSDEDIAK